jgi:hypothetical protein
MPGAVREGQQLERGRRGEGGRHEQRLGDGGVADLLGAALGAEADEVQPGHLVRGRQHGGGGGELEPRREEARGLGALSGSDDRQH